MLRRSSGPIARRRWGVYRFVFGPVVGAGEGPLPGLAPDPSDPWAFGLLVSDSSALRAAGPASGFLPVRHPDALSGRGGCGLGSRGAGGRARSGARPGLSADSFALSISFFYDLRTGSLVRWPPNLGSPRERSPPVSTRIPDRVRARRRGARPGIALPPQSRRQGQRQRAAEFVLLSSLAYWCPPLEPRFVAPGQQG